MLTLGRYTLLDTLARGGMATVHLGRLMGPAGFARTVAIKRLHPHLARDPEFVTMLLDEARLAARIQHPNVVAVLDIVTGEGELFIVMEYVQGEALVRLVRDARQLGRPVPLAVASALVGGALRGLHAAHEVKGDRGEPLDLIHRDFTPHNIMVRRDGTSLVVDFGVAKASGRFNTTEEGKIKGKLPYMAPEQVRGGAVTRQLDLWAAGSVLWETIVGDRLFGGTTEAEVLERLLFATMEPPSARRPDVPPALDAVVMRALERDTKRRYATAEAMADALEQAVRPALNSEVKAWLEELAGERLTAQAQRLTQLETDLSTPTSLNSPAEVLSSLAESGSRSGLGVPAALPGQSVLHVASSDGASPPLPAAAAAPVPPPPPLPAAVEAAATPPPAPRTGGPAPPTAEPGQLGTSAAVPAPAHAAPSLEDTSRYGATAADARAPGLRRGRWGLIAAAVGLAAASGALGWRLSTPGSSEGAGPAATGAPPLAPVTSARSTVAPTEQPAAPPASGAEAAPAPSAAVHPASGATASASAPPPTAPPPAWNPPAGTPARPPAGAPTGGKKSLADCKRTDANGRVTYDRECLK